MERGMKSYKFRDSDGKTSAINNIDELYHVAATLWDIQYGQTSADAATKSRQLLVPPTFQGRCSTNKKHSINVAPSTKPGWQQTIAGEPTEEKFYTFFANKLSNLFKRQAVLIHGLNFCTSLVDLFQNLESNFVFQAFECDFLVISEEHGVFICEVKRVDSTERTRIYRVWNKALKQTNRIEKFLLWLSEHLNEAAQVSKILIYEATIDSHADRWFIRRQSETKAFRKSLNLATMDASKFAEWWGEKFRYRTNKTTKPPYQVMKLIKLLSELRGLRVQSNFSGFLLDFSGSDFSGASSNIPDINCQNFYKKKSVNVIRPCSALADQNTVIFLWPSQQKVLYGPLRQVIIGNPRSGKTLLIEIKAIDLVKGGSKVLIIAPNPQISAYKQAFSTEFADDSSKLVGVTFYTYPTDSSPPSAESVENVFIDEASTYFNVNTLPYVTDLAAKVKGFFWIISLSYDITHLAVSYGLCPSDKNGNLERWKQCLENFRKYYGFQINDLSAVSS